MIKSAVVRVWVVVLLLGLHVGLAVAQPRQGPHRAATDSDRLLDRIDFHPSYASDYSVNRSSRSWGQMLDVSRKIGFLNLGNKWQVTKGMDPDRSDLRSKRGAMSFKLDYSLPRFGAWTVGLNGSFRKDSQLSSFRDVIDDNSDYGLAVNTALLENVMQRLIPPLSEFSLKTNANLGYNQGSNVSRRSIRGATLRDSTRVDGFFRNYDADLSGALIGVDLRVAATSDLSQGTSKTSQRVVEADSLVRVVSDDESGKQGRRYEASATYKRDSTLKATGSGRWVEELNQYWDTQANDQQGGQETKDGKDKSGRFQVEWTPNKVTTVRGEYSATWTAADYELQRLDYTKERKAGSFYGQYVLPQWVGPAAGIKLDVTYSEEVTRNSLEQTSDYRQMNRSLRLSALRKLGPKLQLLVTEDVGLQQYFYADRSNDRDDRRLFTDANLNYYLSARFSGVFSVSWSKRQAVAIPEQRAANNNTGQSYKVETDVTYKRERMSINQRYTVQAEYTFYDFNEDNNNLVRTNSVNTTFRSPIARRTEVSVKHQYQYRDSGTYIRETVGGPRTYAPSSEETRHALTLGTSFSVGPLLRVVAEQLLDQRQSRRAASTKVTTTKRSEFSISVDFDKEISRDFSVSMSFQKTQSNAEKNYWTGRASLNRRF